jgi:hypothetical protein
MAAPDAAGVGGALATGFAGGDSPGHANPNPAASSSPSTIPLENKYQGRIALPPPAKWECGREQRDTIVCADRPRDFLTPQCTAARAICQTASCSNRICTLGEIGT